VQRVGLASARAALSAGTLAPLVHVAQIDWARSALNEIEQAAIRSQYADCTDLARKADAILDGIGFEWSPPATVDSGPVDGEQPFPVTPDTMIRPREIKRTSFAVCYPVTLTRLAIPWRTAEAVRVGLCLDDWNLLGGCSGEEVRGGGVRVGNYWRSASDAYVPGVAFAVRLREDGLRPRARANGVDRGAPIGDVILQPSQSLIMSMENVATEPVPFEAIFYGRRMEHR
jgi:hypothetical protein